MLVALGDTYGLALRAGKIGKSGVRSRLELWVSDGEYGQRRIGVDLSVPASGLCVELDAWSDVYLHRLREKALASRVEQSGKGHEMQPLVGHDDESRVRRKGCLERSNEQLIECRRNGSDLRFTGSRSDDSSKPLNQRAQLLGGPHSIHADTIAIDQPRNDLSIQHCVADDCHAARQGSSNDVDRCCVRGRTTPDRR